MLALKMNLAYVCDLSNTAQLLLARICEHLTTIRYVAHAIRDRRR